MKIPTLSHPLATALMVLSLSTAVIGPAQGQSFVNAPNSNGVMQTIALDGGQAIDLTNPFFKSLGTNGRACVSCHVPSTAWTISPDEIQKRFAKTKGLDPIFRTNDGSNSPLANVSTVAARRAAYSMLLKRGRVQ